jgi:hypothetical protein
MIGGDEGDRTPGLGIANAALSQLSYIPNHKTTTKGFSKVAAAYPTQWTAVKRLFVSDATI